MKKLISPWWALLLLLIIIPIRVEDPAFVESLRLRYFDTLISSKVETTNGIHLVNIDESALEDYGQFPFSRNVYATIVEDLYNRGAGLVVWNIMMPEVDRLGGDAELAETMLALPVILASRPSDKTVNEPINPGAAIINSDYLDTILPYGGIIANIPELENNSVGAGIVSTEPEIDGVVRRMPTVAVVDGVLYPSLALETLRVIAGDPSFQIKLSPIGIDKMRIPQFGKIKTDTIGRVWIDWQQKGIEHSLTNLPKNFNNEIVIIGVTASGLVNPLSTSIGEVWPHHAQASLIATLSNQINISRPDWATGAELISILLLSIFLISAFTSSSEDDCFNCYWWFILFWIPIRN